MIVKIKRMPELRDLPLPSYQHESDSGMDLRATIENTLTLRPMEIAKVPTGIALELPYSVEAQVRPRSGLSSKGILVYFGTIDRGFSGQCCVIIQNLSGQDFIIERGDRIAQLVIAEPIHCELKEVDSLQETTRSTSGWGSTGLK